MKKLYFFIILFLGSFVNSVYSQTPPTRTHYVFQGQESFTAINPNKRYSRTVASDTYTEGDYNVFCRDGNTIISTLVRSSRQVTCNSYVETNTFKSTYTIIPESSWAGGATDFYYNTNTPAHQRLRYEVASNLCSFLSEGYRFTNFVHVDCEFVPEHTLSSYKKELTVKTLAFTSNITTPIQTCSSGSRIKLNVSRFWSRLSLPSGAPYYGGGLYFSGPGVERDVSGNWFFNPAGKNGPIKVTAHLPFWDGDYNPCLRDDCRGDISPSAIATATITFRVTHQPILNLTTEKTFYIDRSQPEFDLTRGPGIVWTGPSVGNVGNQYFFNVPAATQGSHTLNVKKTVNSCVFRDQVTMTMAALPEVNFPSLSNITKCVYDDDFSVAVNATGLVLGTQDVRHDWSGLVFISSFRDGATIDVSRNVGTKTLRYERTVSLSGRDYTFSTSKEVTVVPRPVNDAVVNDVEKCPSDDPNTTLYTSSLLGYSFKWYYGPGGFAGSGSSISFLLTVPGSKSRYVDVVNTVNGRGCESALSARKEVTATLHPAPAAPVSRPVLASLPVDPQYNVVAACGAGVVKFNIAGKASYRYGLYSSFTGTIGSDIETRANANGKHTFTTPSLTTTRRYYLQAFTSKNCFSARIPVEAVVYNIPNAPRLSSNAVCGEGVINLRAFNAGANQIYRWYRSGNSKIYESDVSMVSFRADTTISPANLTFDVSLFNTNTLCESRRATVRGVVDSIPADPIGIDAVRCGAGPVTLRVKNPLGEGTYTWYSQESGGSSLWIDSAYSLQITDSHEDTTVFWVDYRDNEGCLSQRSKVLAIKNFIPVNPASISLSRCETGVLTFAIPDPLPDHTYEWYETLTSLDTIFTGHTYVTEPLNSLTDYFVKVVSPQGCDAVGRAKMEGTIYSNPSKPSVNSGSHCGPGTVNLSVSGGNAGDVYRWYDSSSSDRHFREGDTYNVSLAATKRFYVSILTLAGCEGPRNIISAIIHDVPAAPVPVNDTICGIGNVTLSVADSLSEGGFYTWYSTKFDNTELTQGANYYPSGINVTTSYWVDYTSPDNCTSERTEVLAVVNPIAANPTVTDGGICGSGKVKLSASSSISNPTFRWFKSISGGSPVGTGETFTTDLLPSDKSFYVEVVSPYNCVSDRTKVMASIYPIPKQPVLTPILSPSPSDPQYNVMGSCGAGQVKFNIAGPVYYQYGLYESPIGSVASDILTGFNSNGKHILTVDSLANSHTYYLQTFNSHGCFSERLPVVAVVNNIPKDTTIVGLPANQTFYADTSQARFNLTSGADITWTDSPFVEKEGSQYYFDVPKAEPGVYNLIAQQPVCPVVNTCSLSATRTITILAKPTVSLKSDGNITKCTSDDDFMVTPVTSRLADSTENLSHAWSGLVLSSSSINEATVSVNSNVGTKTLNYTRTIRLSGRDYVLNATKQITVLDNPLPNLPDDQVFYRVTQNPFYLPSDTGITWTGTKEGGGKAWVLQNTRGYYFAAGGYAPPGVYTLTARKTVSAAGGGSCTFSDTLTMRVVPLPTVSLKPDSNITKCISDDDFMVTPVISGLEDGTHNVSHAWSGLVLSSSSINEATVQVNSNVGTKTLNYTRTIRLSGRDYTINANKQITIPGNSIPNLPADQVFYVDISQARFNLTSGAGIIWAGSPFVKRDGNQYYFDVPSAGPGVHYLTAQQIIHPVGANATPCALSDTLTITMVPKPTVNLKPDGNTITKCRYNDPFDVTAVTSEIHSQTTDVSYSWTNMPNTPSGQDSTTVNIPEIARVDEITPNHIAVYRLEYRRVIRLSDRNYVLNAAKKIRILGGPYNTAVVTDSVNCGSSGDFVLSASFRYPTPENLYFFRWYTEGSVPPSGLGTPGSSIMVSLDSPGSISQYVSVVLDAYGVQCESRSKAKGTATLNPIPNAPSVSSNTIYGAGEIVLRASDAGANQIYRWYRSGDSNVHASDVDTVSFPADTATSDDDLTYEVSLFNTNTLCESPRTTVKGVVIDTVFAPIGLDAVRCGPGPVTLKVKNPVGTGTYTWYDRESGDSSSWIGSNYSFQITDSHEDTTIFWVDYTDTNGYLSQRSMVRAIRNPIPKQPTLSPSPSDPQYNVMGSCGTGQVRFNIVGPADYQYGLYQSPSGSTTSDIVTGFNSHGKHILTTGVFGK